MFHKDPLDARLDEEIKAHIELLTDEYVARGMTQTDAHYAALRELGNVTSMRQEYREQGGLPMLENFWLDLKFALRTLRRNPAFAASSIATLTVGLGSMITVLCIASAFLWKPLPFPDPKSLVVIHEMDPRNGPWPFSEPMLLDLQERSKSLSAVAGYRRATLPLSGVAEPEGIQCAAVTPSFFQLFGVTPVVGAVPSDSQPRVFISRSLWKRKWQMNPSVIGRSILLDGASYTVAGIGDLPGDLLPGAELLLPLVARATESRTAHDISVVGRLEHGLVLGQAQAELNGIANSIAKANAQTNAGWGMRAIPIADDLTGPATSRMVWMIFAAVILLWVLACANVAGLQIARNVARRHEMSTRVALGASRTRLLSQTMTESLVLALAGCFLGGLLAQYALAEIRELGAGFFPRLAHVHLDLDTIAIAVGCMLASTAIFGMLSGRPPVFQAGREIDRRDRGRDTLIVMQVALASVLLLAASLLFESFMRLRSVDPGFDADRVLIVPVNLPAQGYDNLRRIAFFDSATQLLARLPEVESVGATNVMIFSGQGTANRFRVDGEPSSEFRSAAWRAVTPGFFPTLGVPLKRGRLFTDADKNGSEEVVILSESMAKQFWPHQDPIGKQLLWGRSASRKTIVGVVGDLRDLAVDESPVPTMFRPFSQLSDAPMKFLIKTRLEPESAIADVRRQIGALEPNAAIEYQPLTETIADSMLGPRASLTVVAAFALVALITAAFGLYGLITYRVNQRQQEIGIRLALGSTPGSVRWQIQKRCLLLVALGAGIGLPVAFGLSSLLAPLLYRTKPSSASSYFAVAITFMVVALVASFAPAFRASHLDPAAAIRHE